MDGLAVPRVFQIERIVGFWFVNAAAAPTTPSELGDRAFLLLEPALAGTKRHSGRKLTERPNLRKTWIFDNFRDFFDFSRF